jgi:hypothetical protein
MRAQFGVFNTASKITGLAARGVERLTFDPEWQVRHLVLGSERALPSHLRVQVQREMRRVLYHPLRARDGVVFGLRNFGDAVRDAAMGVVEAPREGAHREGPKGFAKVPPHHFAKLYP